MTPSFQLEWIRSRRRTIDSIDPARGESIGSWTPDWRTVEAPLATPERVAALMVDGVLRATSGAGVRTIRAPEQSYDVVDPSAWQGGDERWVVGAGLRGAVDLLEWEDIGALVDHMRVLLGYELGCDGVVVAVPFSGSPSRRPGGTRHYLQLVDYGSRKDPALDLYLSRGFWFAGRAESSTVAYLARHLK